MPKRILQLFASHPGTVGETYAEHMQAATSFGVRLILAGLACLVHALLPWLFESTASAQVRLLHKRMSERGAVRAEGAPPTNR